MKYIEEDEGWHYHSMVCSKGYSEVSETCTSNQELTNVESLVKGRGLDVHVECTDFTFDGVIFEFISVFR